MKITKKVNSLFYSNGVIFYAVIIATLLLIFWVLNSFINIKKQEINSILENEAANIERIFQSKIDDTAAIAKSINDQIIGHNDKKYIYNVLKSFKATPQLNQSFSWTSFGWIDADNKLVADSVKGIYETPLDLSDENFISLLKNSSKIKLGLPEFYNAIDKFIIPGGVGSFDEKNQFIGAVVFGFEVDVLAKILYGAISNFNLRLDIIDQKGNHILTANNCVMGHAEEIRLDQTLSKIIDSYQVKNGTAINIGWFTEPSAIYVKRIGDTPYFVTLKYNQKVLKREMQNYILAKSFEISSIFLIAAILLIIVYKREALHSRKINILKNVAENSNKAKSEFMLQIAHEIRNYLYGIQGAAEIVKNDLSDYKKGKIDKIYLQQDIELTSEITVTVADLLAFVNDMIDLNQVESGEFKIFESKEPLDLEKIIMQSVKLLYSKALENHVKFEIKIAKNLHRLSGLDPRRVKQIMINLVSNAIKYSLSDSVVEITASNLGERKLKKINSLTKVKKLQRVEITVKDYGRGMAISEINLDKIFSKKNNINSLGLGLPIVKYLVEKQGGILEIESEKNKGTKVTIIL